MRLSLSLAALVSLAPGLVAQTGTFTTYGNGCPGSAKNGPGCVSLNWGGTFNGNIGASANFALLANTGASPRVICGFQLFCKTRNNQQVTMRCWIYDRVATGGPNQILRATTMVVGGTPAAYTATVSPLVLRANTDFFIVFDNNVALNLPINTTGSPGTHYFGGPPTWRGPFSTVPWNYNVLCCGQGSVPVLSNTGVPTIGKSFSIDLSRAKPGTGAALVVGGSKTKWLSFNLPLDLVIVGAQGCFLNASLDLLLPFAVDAQGMASATVPVPNDRGLIGAEFHNQYLIADQVNALGLVSTNGGTAKIGG